MNLYLVRHAEAVPVGGAITRDAERPLSPDGEMHARRMAGVLARIDPSVNLVLASPLLRARQTAMIFQEVLPARPEVLVTENLSPGFRSSTLAEEAASFRDRGSVMAIGHQPDMTKFIAWLVADGSPAAIWLPPAGMAGILLEGSPTEPDASLRWLLTPDLAAALRP